MIEWSAELQMIEKDRQQILFDTASPAWESLHFIHNTERVTQRDTVVLKDREHSSFAQDIENRKFMVLDYVCSHEGRCIEKKKQNLIFI